MNITGDQLLQSDVPWWLVASLRNRYYLTDYVELGAGYGHSSVIAADVFQRVICVEVDPKIYRDQRADMVAKPNVTRWLGSSLDRLPEVFERLQGPAFWYLDSHWAGAGPKLGVECPLLQELDIITSRHGSENDVVLIDNAGMFCAPPKPPHNPAEWPTLREIELSLKATWPYVTMVADTILATPSPLVTVF